MRNRHNLPQRAVRNATRKRFIYRWMRGKLRLFLTAQPTDYELLQLVAQGNMRAYRELVGRYLVMGVKIAERMLGNRQDAEDVMQEVCVKMWRESPKWKPQAKFSTWLYRVIINACIDRRRRFAPVTTDAFDEILDDRPLAEEVLIKRQRAQSVKIALQLLPDRQRAAITLNYYEEMSNQEAAEAMGIALGAYQQLLFRARQSLKAHLVEDLSDEAARTGS